MGRGVKQGSVLSPALFLLVMDLLLHQLESSGLGLSVNEFYGASFMLMMLSFMLVILSNAYAFDK